MNHPSTLQDFKTYIQEEIANIQQMPEFGSLGIWRMGDVTYQFDFQNYVKKL